MSTNNYRSSWYPAAYGYDPEDIKTACQVLRSFYNYLRYHRVCPEYDEQIQAALKMCDTAEAELTKVNNACLALPGDFNTSASTLLGGAQAGLFAADKDWAKESLAEGVDVTDIGLRDVGEARAARGEEPEGDRGGEGAGEPVHVRGALRCRRTRDGPDGH